MPRGDARTRGVEHRAIEDMGHSADHVTGGVAGQVGVGVERDHVAHLRQEPGVAGHVRKSPVGAGESCAAKDCVHVG